MSTKTLALFALVALGGAQVGLAAQIQTRESGVDRSPGAHPVVYDDYPESELVWDLGNDILLTITGEARTRFEWRENNLDFSSNGTTSSTDDDDFDDDYYVVPMRFNLGMRFDLPRDVAAVIELQSGFEAGDSGRISAVNTLNNYLRPGGIPESGFGRGGADSARSTLSSAGDNVYVHQGYIEAAHIGGSNMSLRIGRQELAYGTEWLLGNQDWYDGVSHDGIKFIAEFSDNSRLDIFWMKRNESQNFSGPSSGGRGDNDVDLFGAYFSTESLGGSNVGLDGYLLNMRDHRNMAYFLDTDDPTGGRTIDLFTISQDGTTYRDLYWAGVRLFGERRYGWNWSAELTYMFGDIAVSNTTPFASTDSNGNSFGTNLDHAALGFEGFVSYTWDTPTSPAIKLGLTYAQGTGWSDYDSGDSNTFWTPQGEVHPRLGLADIIDASNVIAWNVGYAGTSGNHAWGVDLFHFTADEVDPEINDDLFSTALVSSGGLDDHLGNELDLWYNYQYSENLALQIGVAWFMTGDYIEEYNRCEDSGCDSAKAANSAATIVSSDDAMRAYANLLLRF